jgi:hypothetical protein
VRAEIGVETAERLEIVSVRKTSAADDAKGLNRVII